MSDDRWYVAWESCDGLSDAEITVSPPDGPYPAMVHLECGCMSGLLPDDAWVLAGHLRAAVLNANRLNLVAARVLAGETDAP